MSTQRIEIETNAKERLMTDQSARELAPLLSVDERAFVSVLATAELYQLDAKKLIRGYAEELGSNEAQELVDKLRPGLHPLDAAAEVDKLMPEPCRVALNSSRASGTLHSFYRSWLAQSVDDRSTWVRHEHTNAAVLGRLGIRILVCAWLLTFILLYVIPEHQKMYEEFGIEYNSTLITFLAVSAWIAKLFPVFLLLLLCVSLYILIFRRSIMQNYMRRWLPGRWRQVALPTPILKRKLLAWDLLAFRGNNANSVETDWGALVSSRAVNSHEAGVMKQVASKETQAWLLRNMADRKHRLRDSRFSFGINAFSLVFQIALAAIIVLATFTIFSMMLKLMETLG